ncbi:hypothetical protein [Streptomyces sp. SID1121]|uniref:hypothetical protein n=1 Tax=Streptomyces sp. SID1121 TaxID=3425888 RepID=UPI004056DF6E
MANFLRRIPEEELVQKDIRYLALMEVDLITLYRRWGRPDVALDSLAEWLCFAFSLPDGEKFALQREAQNPPTSGFFLSVTMGLFSAEAAERVAAALDIPGVRVLEVSAEVSR